MLCPFAFVLHISDLGSQFCVVFLQLLVLNEKLIVGFVEVCGCLFDQLLGLLSDLLRPCLNAVGSGLELFGVVGGVELIVSFFKNALFVFEQLTECIHKFLF